jgi:alpha-tubulin suppressor-like RCC1 family protein
MRVSAVRLAATALTALALLASTACSEDADLLSPNNAASMRVPDDPPPWIPQRPNPFRGLIGDISSGAHHVCARTYGGTVSCWGSNTYGQIGVASTDKCGEYGYGLQPCVPHPTAITGSAGTQSFSTANVVTAGSHHTCVLASGTPWCWGSNTIGEIGNGATSAGGVPTPTPVSGGPYTALSAGAGATCGISNGALFCWGQVGMGTAASTSPVLVSLQSGWSNELNVGSMDACARRSIGGWSCWGSNWNGQLGMDPSVWQYFQGPVGPILAGATNVVSTDGYTCLDAPDGTIKCMGLNDSGQLGDPTFGNASTFSLRTVGGGLPLSHVAVGATHACALDSQGQAFCWGSDNFGELGRGRAGGGVLPNPAPVVGGLTFTKLVAGMYHTCGLTTDYRVFCWGSNYSGQLGFPNHTHLASNPTPVEITF